MDRFLQDLRFGLRMVRKSPGFSALVVLTFALGIGVNMAIFSVVDAIVLRPLAVAQPDRIVRIMNEDPAHPERGAASSWIELDRFRTQSRAFAGVAASDRRAVIVKHDDAARCHRESRCSGGGHAGHGGGTATIMTVSGN